MRLTKIKLAGFKSFVDPTTIHIPSSLIGIVGPNGCGKSNVIDAVRWVMGESSAKHLRGASMDDVIFTGSAARKPVGQASVELVFDNNDGTLGGEYASYNEIALRRRITREGQSQYYLNNSRCRRRDITDIFLGTGLGPRSYAIIEQGMVNRLIEAKPEELRVYLEEAAGISKYKERRRETENRIRHTRENLERLNDLREELEKQLERLKRQAATARRFKTLKEEERRLKAELLALRYRDVNQELEQRQSRQSELQTQVEATVAEQRSLERHIEADRQRYSEANDAFNKIQAQFYQLGGEISRVEQSIKHLRESRSNAEKDLERVEQLWQEVAEHIASQQQQLAQLSEQRLEDEPAQEELLMQQEQQADQLLSAEEAMETWQQQWHDYSQRSAEPLRIAHGERSRMDQLEAQVQRHQQRRERLEGEQANLDGSELDSEIEQWQEQLLSGEEQQQEAQQQQDDLQESLSASQSVRRELESDLNQQRQRQQKQSGRLASLEALQQAALGQQEQGVVSWLQSQNLADRPRLAEQLEVDEGWQRAVETVLADHLEAVCVDQIDPVAPLLESLQHGSLLLLERDGSAAPINKAESLLNKVRSGENLQALLACVYVADDLATALQQRTNLQAHESLITPEGIWLGRNWLRIKQDDDKNSGVLARSQEIKTLSAEQAQLEQQIEQLEQRLEMVLATAQGQEQQLEEQRQMVTQSARDISEAERRLESARLRREQLSQRWQRLGEEAEEIQLQLESDHEDLQLSEQRYHEALEQSEVMAEEGETLRLQQDELNQRLNELRQQARELSNAEHALALRLESNRSALTAAEQSVQRAQAQRLQLGEQREVLQQQLGCEDQPVDQLQRELDCYLADRVGVEKRLSDAQERRQEIEARQREQEKQRLAVEQAVTAVREQLQQEALAAQESKVRCGTLLEQLAETDFSLERLLQELDESASVKIWQPNVEQVAQKIQRLGAINLAAIDEYEEQLQRKEHMQSQYNDINEALLTLETAIAKIDRETRSRFKTTFDQVNAKMQHFFPRLFGGGKASLELTDDDLLTTGVVIRAQPPGKKINNIHLLSGGEKALTAVALVFAFFELNPSPFCMLDEVDAPLDDANVGRFCELVKEMSARVQFIFITHNKSTMELSEQLMGVTMHEAGVSRLVTVDVHEAAKMASG